jgi:hypothetical protein
MKGIKYGGQATSKVPSLCTDFIRLINTRKAQKYCRLAEYFDYITAVDEVRQIGT